MQRKRKNGFRDVAAFLVHAFQEPLVAGSVIHQDGFVLRHAGAHQALPNRDMQFADPMRHFRPETIVLRVHQPDAAAVRTNQIARHAGVEFQHGIQILRGANLGRVIENHP